MTKVIMNIKGGSIMYDCLNHAGDHDACTVMATLSNVLVEAADRIGVEATIYNPGHVRVDIPDASAETIEVFEAVKEVIRHAAVRYPEHIKVY